MTITTECKINSIKLGKAKSNLKTLDNTELGKMELFHQAVNNINIHQDIIITKEM